MIVMLASLSGCGTRLDGAVSKSGKSAQSVQATEQIGTEQSGNKSEATEKYLDVAGATEADYSKYDKSAGTDQKQSAGNSTAGNNIAGDKAGSSNETNADNNSKSGNDTNNQSGNENGVTVDATKANSASDSKSETTCTLTVTCATILDHKKDLAAGKEKLIPSDGIIYSNKKVVFKKGETVFDVLQREMKANRIQMEFTSAPAYNSDYVEAIDNLYEFDCGQNSGWKYSVNGEFPNYGCSQYQLKDQDVIQWAYTCDLGKDLEKK